MSEMQLNELTEEQINFHLILHSGNARSKVIQSLREYREGRPAEAERFLELAEEDLKSAHDIHFKMIQKEAEGKKTEFSLLLMHAEDHLMSTLTMKELVKEMIEIFKSRNL